MAIRRFDDMDRMFEEMTRMFDQMRTSWAEPRGVLGEYDDSTTELFEEDGEYVFVMDLPGFEKEDITLTYDEGSLHVAARHDVEEGDEHMRAFRSRRASERVSLPGAVVEDEISASYKNGILEVHLPTVEPEEPSGRHIDIE